MVKRRGPNLIMKIMLFFNQIQKSNFFRLPRPLLWQEMYIFLSSSILLCSFSLLGKKRKNEDRS